MIGIGPILIIVGVIAIIGTYVAVIHWALQSSEANEGEVKLTVNVSADNSARINKSQPKKSSTFVPIKT